MEKGIRRPFRPWSTIGSSGAAWVLLWGPSINPKGTVSVVANRYTQASQIGLVLCSYIQNGTTCQDRIHDTLKPAKRKGR
jgi:hypothetical protein